jgi:hypothetical protein
MKRDYQQNSSCSVKSGCGIDVEEREVELEVTCGRGTINKIVAIL